MFTYNFGYFLRKQCRDLINECVYLNFKRNQSEQILHTEVSEVGKPGVWKLLSCEGICEFALLKVCHIHLENYFWINHCHYYISKVWTWFNIHSNTYLCWKGLSNTILKSEENWRRTSENARESFNESSEFRMWSKDLTKVSPNLWKLLQGPDSTTNGLPANGKFLSFRILVQRKYVESRSKFEQHPTKGRCSGFWRYPENSCSLSILVLPVQNLNRLYFLRKFHCSDECIEADFR